jgi:5-methylcytosine-specific restriction endonuclease McrA
MWCGGKEIKYNGSWFEIRRQARERDNHTCQSCGITCDELGQEPDVHHIIPVRERDDSEQAHRLDNVICLCRECHQKVEAGDLEIALAQG